MRLLTRLQQLEETVYVMREVLASHQREEAKHDHGNNTARSPPYTGIQNPKVNQVSLNAFLTAMYGVVSISPRICRDVIAMKPRSDDW